MSFEPFAETFVPADVSSSAHCGNTHCYAQDQQSAEFYVFIDIHKIL